MRKCMVNGCKSKDGTPGFQSKLYALHQFPNSAERIKAWLQASGDYFDNIDAVVQYIMQRRGKSYFRICSEHFESDMFVSGTRTNLCLKSYAVPTKFPRPSVLSIVNELALVSEESNPDVEMDEPVDPSVRSASKPTSFAFDHNYLTDFSYTISNPGKCFSVHTNTDIIQKANRGTSTSHFLGRRNASAQTINIISKKHVSTSTWNLVKCKDAYTWIDVSDEAIDPLAKNSITNDFSQAPPKKFSKAKSQRKKLPKPETLATEEMDVDFLPAIQPRTVGESHFTPVSRTSSALRDQELDAAMFNIDSINPDFLPENHSTDIEFVTEPTPDVSVAERKFIVFETCLDQLLRSVQTCKFPVKCTAPIIDIEKSTSGTLLTVYTVCKKKHRCLFWKSQPMVGRKSCGNILASAAIVFSGSDFKKVYELFEIFGVQFISITTHRAYQQNYLFPIVNLYYRKERNLILSSLKGRVLSLSADGQCDSPGYGKKYCTYCIVEKSTQKIIECNTIQVSESSSSSSMESLAFSTCMENVLAERLNIGVLVTDRHEIIRKIMMEEYKQINHQFDVWHYCKSLRKKLENLARDPTCKELVPWTNAIVNHFWASCYLGKGNPDLLRERWVSVLHHITNVHEWESENGIKRCSHKEMSESENQERARIWISRNGVAHSKLGIFVNDGELRSDLKHLTEFGHTGSLEVYHNLLLKYCPKQTNFSIDDVLARAKLAVLAHNASIDRPPDTDQPSHEDTEQVGHLRHKPFYLKRAKICQVKKLCGATYFDHIFPMMVDLIRLASGEIDI
ncbi:G patch domain-containing protein 4 isoform X1 [Pelobates fuscus]|uniref:G patch domain-containing protein 4 isoform X1 n=1 Tax=Pelobates fuscus TaxID=191477 RepID=UPI002FE49F09